MHTPGVGSLDDLLGGLSEPPSARSSLRDELVLVSGLCVLALATVVAALTWGVQGLAALGASVTSGVPAANAAALERLEHLAADPSAPVEVSAAGANLWSGSGDVSASRSGGVLAFAVLVDGECRGVVVEGPVRSDVSFPVRTLLGRYPLGECSAQEVLARR